MTISFALWSRREAIEELQNRFLDLREKQETIENFRFSYKRRGEKFKQVIQFVFIKMDKLNELFTNYLTRISQDFNKRTQDHELQMNSMKKK